MNSVFRKISAVTAAVTLLAVSFPQNSTLTSNASPEKKYIALTFDDGPNTSTTNQVLDILEEYNAKASFFLVGTNINEESAKSVKRAYDMGCEIDNHSKSHVSMADMSEQEVREEISYVNDKVYEITGEYPSFFRPPYIAVSAVMYDAIDMPFICGAGCEDWESSVTAEQRAENVLSQAKDGQIILMHDAQGNDQTVEALKTIIPALQNDSYTLVTLNEMFELQGVTPDEDSMYSVVPYSEDNSGKSAEASALPSADDYDIPEIQTEKKAIPDTEGLRFTRDMRLGWNLGNTLDAYDDEGVITNELDLETYWNGGYKTTQEMIDAVKKAGFNTLRVPVSWHNHVDDHLNISEAWMNRVQEVVDYAFKNDMYVILNVHHDNSENTMYPDSAHYEQSSEYMTRIWEQIAERFKDYSDKLIFETMNEPRLTGHTYEWWLNMSDADCIDSVQTINKLNQDCVNTIRSSGGNNANRYISVPGYDCSVDGATNSYFKLPEDTAENRLIVAVHAYTPYGFALAGTTDSASTDQFDLTKDTAEIDQTLDAIYDTYICNGIPVYIGEFGAREKNGNTQARVDWASYYVANASACGIPCCWWDDNAFRLLDRSDASWEQPQIVTALNQYAMGKYTPDLTPSEQTQTDIKQGKVSYDTASQSYSISLPSASNQICLNIQLSENAEGGASGCIANGFMKDNIYYWAMVPWKATKSGEVVIDIDKDFGTLAYSVGDETFTSEDEALITEAKNYLKTLKNFQAQVWWVGNADYKTIDVSNATITEAYLKTEDSKEETAVFGDVNEDGKIDILDVITLNRAILGKENLSAQGQKNADVDKSGKPDATDSLNIMKYIVGLITF